VPCPITPHPLLPAARLPRTIGAAPASWPGSRVAACCCHLLSIVLQDTGSALRKLIHWCATRHVGHFGNLSRWAARDTMSQPYRYLVATSRCRTRRAILRSVGVSGKQQYFFCLYVSMFSYSVLSKLNNCSLHEFFFWNTFLISLWMSWHLVELLITWYVFRLDLPW